METQRDFFSPGGSCFKPEAVAAAKNIRRLFQWARRREVPVISTVLRVRRDHVGPMAPLPHCIEGTDGEKRVNGTVLNRYVDLGIRNITDLPEDLFESYQQVIFEKRYTDIFEHARAERLLTELKVDTFVVCGAGSDTSIVEAVVGLRNRRFGVILASDAILDLGHLKGEMAWLRMIAKGAVPMSTTDIVTLPRAKRSRQRILRDALRGRTGVAR